MSPPELSLDFVVHATQGGLVRQGADRFYGVSIDGRAVPQHGLWFALRGQHHDGHDFAAQAVESGAVGLVIERGRGRTLAVPREVSLIEVDDPARALGRLAQAHRAALHELVVVGVTGSSGKTTTRELCAAILAAAAGPAAVHKSTGNLNNHLGVPLTLLGLQPHHRYAVVEMGMSGLGEIAYLASLAQPQVGVIVNVGPAHLEQLGSLDNIARAKGELFAALAPTGIAILPDNDSRLAAQVDASRAACRIHFGTRPGVAVRVAHVRVDHDGTAIDLRLPDGAHVSAKLAALGSHHALNAAAAAAAAYALDVGPEAIARGLSAAANEKHRTVLLDIAGRHVLDDCYNANPLSARAALDTLAALRVSQGAATPSGRTIAVLGDMLELGEGTAELHRGIGRHAAQVGTDCLLAIGQRAEDLVAGAHQAGLAAATAYSDLEPLLTALQSAAAPGDWVLVKASRGMQLERVIDGLRSALAAAAA